MTGLYVHLIDHLIEEGIFMDKGELFRESLRRTFRAYGLKPFYIAEETEGETEDVASS